MTLRYALRYVFKCVSLRYVYIVEHTNILANIISLRGMLAVNRVLQQHCKMRLMERDMLSL